MRPFNDSKRSLLVVVLAASLATSAVAGAAGPSPIDATAEQKKEATAHFAVGKQALGGGDYSLAVTELRASLEVVDSPNAHLELARALRESGKLGDAWAEFGRAAETATKLAPKESRYLKTAEAAAFEKGEVEGRLAFVTVDVVHAPADATLTLGGRIVAAADWNAPLVVAPGNVDVVLSDGAGAELVHRSVSAAAGQTISVSVDARPATGPAVEAVASPNDDEKTTSDSAKELPALDALPAPSHRSPLRPLAFAAGGLAVAGLGTFTVFGLMTNATYNDLKSTCPSGCPAGKRSEIDRGVMDQTVANVGLGVGLAALAASTVMFVLSAASSPPSSATAVVVAPTSGGAYVGVRGCL